MNLARRIAKLERIKADTQFPRIVLRFEGPGSEDMRQPTQEELDATIRLAADNDAMKALQQGFAYTASKTPTMEVLQQYGTVYRMRRTQEVFGVCRG